MVRNAMTSPLATGAAALQQSYQISENDVYFVKMLGQGASGLVQKAFWPAKAEFVAVKKISVLEREKRHQLMNDIKALCNTPDVPGLIRFYGAYHCADKGQIAVALEYMDGGSLADVLERVGKIPERVLACITKQVLLGLAYLHANHTVHRDIKPANILMSVRGEPKVSDFGISAFVDNTVAQCHTFLGTVTYMSPERINGQPYSFPADIWSLGLTLLECVTGRYPYDASGGTIELMIQILEEDCPFFRSTEKGNPEISPDLMDLVSRCLNKDPMKRPTAEELLRHPWVASLESEAVDLRRFMRCMYNSEEKVADAVAICSARLYNTISNNWMDPDSIASFYTSESMLTSTTNLAVDMPKYNYSPGTPITGSTSLKGRYTIAEHIQRIAAAASSQSATFEILSTKHGHEKSESKGEVGLKTTSSKKKSLADEGVVTVVHKIALRKERGITGAYSVPKMSMPPAQPATQNNDDTEVGLYEETLVMRLRDVTALVPGVGFSIRSHDIRWIRPLVGLGRHGGGGGPHLKHDPPNSCRQQ